ncbi:NAD(P)H-dependent flavin oxidoreductase [Brevibacillus centrosporus]|uniref:Probable nitronate monooxygenase n=1 Tax=Brevibacillus centrosporus TaxID=54910 RepID=A0A1I3X7C6_9BACL|nr:nitronate monooxygenase [Brevibacillus centrosporus]MEC2129236.1 nitronate monooxygenase [Brevibacillus centrosporus]MED4911068.1 nitronate monooxygenase [Brevibacillus centrosporus]RNB70422.1 nitronate monooxygenase [Brevibacillus centrosporus]SFK15565.1 nitronate monooxygenase [Brevibacillus centrosporus]GED29469.1 2-nitropropane dioxygenase [Brevibacillus centrosporus]
MKNRLPEWISEHLVLPVITAPMFLVSNPQLVISACKSGVIGSFPSLNARTVDDLRAWMSTITEELARSRAAEPDRKIAPWAINIVIRHLNERLEEELELIKKYQPPFVFTALGDPAPVVEIVHAYGGIVFSDVTNIYHAKKAVKSGVDGLILVCGGAGGHAGTLNSFAFLSAIREFWDGIAVLAGGIACGQEILAARTIDADLVFMGTRFIASVESNAGDDYKQMLIDASIEDIIYTPTFSGIPANYLKPSIVSEGLDPEQLGSYAEFVKTGRKAWKNIWSAGHGVGRTKSIQTVAEIVNELQTEYDQTLAAFKQLPASRSPLNRSLN